MSRPRNAGCIEFKTGYVNQVRVRNDESIGRAVAFCVGAYTFLSLRGTANLWWIDVRPWPGAVLAPIALALLFHAVRPGWWGRAAAGIAGAIVVLNVVAFYRSPFSSAFPVPLSLFVLVLLALIWRAPRLRGPRLKGFAWIGTPVLLGGLFPLAHVLTYGMSDYARPADRIVVFGARCYADGKPSLTLEDRVRTACGLYRRGLAPKLLLSGGPGDGPVHETEAMRKFALAEGVPDHAIEIDRAGLDTMATVHNTGPGRLLAVSHFYHLPRIQLAYRSAGRTVYTVPAHEMRPVRGTRRFVAREIPAFWWYWLRHAVS